MVEERGMGTDSSLVSGRLVYRLPQNGTLREVGGMGGGRCHHGLALFGLVDLQCCRFCLWFCLRGGGLDLPLSLCEIVGWCGNTCWDSKRFGSVCRLFQFVM